MKDKGLQKLNSKRRTHFNPHKWGDEAQRIGYMMDVLFGKISVSEATKNINN
jgi:hypothetical protein